MDAATPTPVQEIAATHARTQPAAPEVVVDGVEVRYGRKTAVAGVDWALGPGLHALVGPNGAGKSSLLAAMATLRRPARGSVSVTGQVGIAHRRRLTGYLPQDNLPRSRFTVAEFVSYAAWLRGLSPHSVTDAVEVAIDLAHLGEVKDARIGSLSGGQRRRVGIAAALVGRPALLLLDEPSAGLDVAQRSVLGDALRDASSAATVIWSTHIVEDVLGHADTVTVMDRGRFVFHGPTEEFSDAADLAAFERRYLSLVGS